MSGTGDGTLHRYGPSWPRVELQRCHTETRAPHAHHLPCCHADVQPAIASAVLWQRSMRRVTPQMRVSRHSARRQREASPNTRAGSALRLIVPLVLRRDDPAHARRRRLVHQAPFDTLNELSTPPAADHGDRLGGDQAITIDHGPRRTPCARRGAPRGCRHNPRRRPPRHQAASDGWPSARWRRAPPSSRSTPRPARGGGDDRYARAGECAERYRRFLRLPDDGRRREAGRKIDVGVRRIAFVAYLDGSTARAGLSIPRDTARRFPATAIEITTRSPLRHPVQQLVDENLLGNQIDTTLIDFAGVETLVDSSAG